MKKVAVILCGSGYRDGSEIREAVGALLFLSQGGAKVQCFAPNDFQFDVVNCLSGESSAEKRNMLVESARIARGEVKDIESLQSEDFDALVIPGGFGVAKNLCNFALQGSKGSVRPDVERAIKAFFSENKPIGAICIAPALVGLVLKNKSLNLTLGESGETSQELEKCGHKHVSTKVNEAYTDVDHKIVTTGAYMFGSAPIHEIFQGIHQCVKEVLRLCS